MFMKKYEIYFTFLIKGLHDKVDDIYLYVEGIKNRSSFPLDLFAPLLGGAGGTCSSMLLLTSEVKPGRRGEYSVGDHLSLI